jgi:hypothetical protein
MAGGGVDVGLAVAVEDGTVSGVEAGAAAESGRVKPAEGAAASTAAAAAAGVAAAPAPAPASGPSTAAGVAAVLAGKHCAQCLRSDKGVKYKLCSGCEAVRYCSKECQRAHWKAGHMRECVPV